MKNLALAGLGLILVIVLIFLFSSKQKVNNDIFVPSPIPLESPKPSFITNNETTKSAMTLSFPILKKEEISRKKELYLLTV